MDNGEATKIEPRPRLAGTDYVLTHVLADLVDRSDFGLQKYGTRLQVENGRDPLVDAYQEAIDLVMYLKQELMTREAKRKASSIMVEPIYFGIDPASIKAGD